MRTILRTHRKAMEWADEGQAQLNRGDESAAKAAFRKAMDLEREAAYATDANSEPDRSVLFRSAGSLALDCEETRLAEQLLAAGLAGDPPEEIAEEIRDLLEQVHFRRHLEVRGLTLDAKEVQMSIAGGAVGYGVASSDEFTERVRDFEALVLRTAERKLGHPYREAGIPKNRLKDDFEIFLSVPRAASYAVTLKLGRPTEQLSFWDDDEGTGVIDEVLDLLEVVQKRDRDELLRRIPERPYLLNFSALARKLAPDGKNVSLVGLTSNRLGRSRAVALTATREELKQLTPPMLQQDMEAVIDPPSEPVTVKGVLHYASVIGGGAGTIMLEEPSGPTHEIAVPVGMMTDIVRPLWDYVVLVTGFRKGDRIVLEDIARAED